LTVTWVLEPILRRRYCRLAAGG